MKPLAEELIAVLTRELDLYNQVRELVEEERLALLSGPVDRVLGIVRRKDTLLLQIRTVDESRDLICTRIARQYSLARKSITLSEIIARCENPVAARMVETRDRLRDCIERLGDAGRTNAALCRNGIETIRRVIENISLGGAAASKNALYERTGSRKPKQRNLTLNVRT